MKRFSSLNPVLKNMILAVAVLFLLTIIPQLFMSVFTRHNSELEVPDFSGLSVDQAGRLAKDYRLEAIVTDSVYVRSVPGGYVINQDPAAGGKVKKGRRIRLTINALVKRQVAMPELRGYSLRSAAAELSARGLSLDGLLYVNDMATNNVLSQRCNGREVEPGTMLPGDSPIVLVLGMNGDCCTTAVPNLNGMRYSNVIEKIYDSSLNVGKVVFENRPKTYLDSINSVVVKQYPDASIERRMGSTVSIWLSAAE